MIDMDEVHKLFPGYRPEFDDWSVSTPPEELLLYVCNIPLRDPLNSIGGCATILLNENNREDYQYCIEMILRPIVYLKAVLYKIETYLEQREKLSSSDNAWRARAIASLESEHTLFRDKMPETKDWPISVLPDKVLLDMFNVFRSGADVIEEEAKALSQEEQRAKAAQTILCIATCLKTLSEKAKIYIEKRERQNDAGNA